MMVRLWPVNDSQRQRTRQLSRRDSVDLDIS
jgi:hypothetical protein